MRRINAIEFIDRIERCEEKGAETSRDDEYEKRLKARRRGDVETASTWQFNCRHSRPRLLPRSNKTTRINYNHIGQAEGRKDTWAGDGNGRRKKFKPHTPTTRFPRTRPTTSPATGLVRSIKRLIRSCYKMLWKMNSVADTADCRRGNHETSLMSDRGNEEGYSLIRKVKKFRNPLRYMDPLCLKQSSFRRIREACLPKLASQSPRSLLINSHACLGCSGC